MTSGSPPQPAPPLWDRARGTLIASALVVAVGLALAFMASATLTRSAPSWWRQPTVNDHTAARATALENAAVSQLYLARPSAQSPPDDLEWSSEPWSVALSEGDINAWLAARLPRWLEGQPGMPNWPETMSELQVRLEDGSVRTGVRVRSAEGPRFVTTSFTPRIDEHGSLWLTASWVHIGRLPVPAGWVIGNQTGRDGVLPPELTERNETKQFLETARGRAPFATTPILALEGDRRVRLLGVRVRPGRLELTMRTETRPPIR